MNTAPSAPDHSLKLVFQTMPQTVNIGPDGLLPLGWTLAMLDRAGAVLPRGHFGLPVQLVHMASIRVHARPQLGDWSPSARDCSTPAGTQRRWRFRPPQHHCATARMKRCCMPFWTTNPIRPTPSQALIREPGE